MSKNQVKKITTKATLKEHEQKNLATLSGFWLLRGKLCDKNFFSDNVEWGSKNLWKIISADAKANKNNNE